MPQERLQKILAAAGVASRRECEEMILEGRVSVNGRVVREMPALADPERDRIQVDGQALRVERRVYLLLHKPKGVHSGSFERHEGERVHELLRGVRERVVPVGRLDAESTGLLLLTNDTSLAERLGHPRHGIPRTYRAHVRGLLTDESIARMRKGVWLPEGKVQADDARIVFAAREGSVLQITLREGRNRDVRQLLLRTGHPARKLMRSRLGSLSVEGLVPGEMRALTLAEVDALQKYGRPDGGDAPRRKMQRPAKRAASSDRPASPPGRGRSGQRPPARRSGQAGKGPRDAKRRQGGPGRSRG